MLWVREKLSILSCPFTFTLRTMFEPIRGGTRGGQAEFKWSDVSADKDREVRLVETRLSCDRWGVA